MFDSNPARWGGRRPMIAGLCAELAREFGLPLGAVRLVACVFMVLPTGLTYLALALLANLRQGQPTIRPNARPSRPMPGAGALNRDWDSVRQRLGALEPRLGRIEAFVTSGDFELHRGFRRMDGQ